MRLFLAALALAAAPAALAQDSQRVEWNRPAEPFRIVGNVYYVGTAGLAVYLVTSPKGHVLIDGALSESVPQIAANIRKLGFRVEDVKVLLNNHAHWDHADGLAGLKKLSHARLVASAADRLALEAGQLADRPDSGHFAPVTVNRVVGDGGKVKVGGNVLIAHLTPGHTKGCTSWSMEVRDPRISVGTTRVLFACSLTVAGLQLTHNPGYPNAAADFRTSFAKLRRLGVDVFLTFHPEFFDMEAKRAKLAKGNIRAFVDPGELGRRVDAAETAFNAELARQSKPQ